jgi:hypothetical protein
MSPTIHPVKASAAMGTKRLTCYASIGAATAHVRTRGLVATRKTDATVRLIVTTGLSEFKIARSPQYGNRIKRDGLARPEVELWDSGFTQ